MLAERQYYHFFQCGLIVQPCFNRKKRRLNQAEPKEAKEEVSPPAPSAADPDKYEYSTVDECASILSRAGLDQRRSLTPEGLAVAAATSGPKDGSLKIVECELYSEPADSVRAMPDISPYACFYGSPRHQVLKVGWLDKLSPQGWDDDSETSWGQMSGYHTY